MDKYVNKNSDLNNGLDMLGEFNYINRNKKKKDNFDEKLVEFKKLVISRLDNFNPLIKNKNNNFIDNILKSMWIEHITKNITKEKEINLYHMLNFDTDKEKTVRFSEESLISNIDI